MYVFLPEHQSLLRKMVDAGVDFILIGGYAVIYHGYGRSTGDLDIWIRPDNGNKMRVISALKGEGFDDELLHGLSTLDFTEAQVISFDDPPYKVDILTRISGVEFEDAFQQAKNAVPDGIPVKFLQLHHLVISKFNTGRSKDAADIDELQRVEAARNKK